MTADSPLSDPLVSLFGPKQWRFLKVNNSTMNWATSSVAEAVVQQNQIIAPVIAWAAVFCTDCSFQTFQGKPSHRIQYGYPILWSLSHWPLWSGPNHSSASIIGALSQNWANTLLTTAATRVCRESCESKSTPKLHTQSCGKVKCHSKWANDTVPALRISWLGGFLSFLGLL